MRNRSGHRLDARVAGAEVFGGEYLLKELFTALPGDLDALGLDLDDVHLVPERVYTRDLYIDGHVRQEEDSW